MRSISVTARTRSSSSARPVLKTGMFAFALIALCVMAHPRSASATPHQSAAPAPTVLRGASSLPLWQAPADPMPSSVSEPGTPTVLRGSPAAQPAPETAVAPKPICPEGAGYIPGYGCVLPEESGPYEYPLPVVAVPVVIERRAFVGSRRRAHRFFHRSLPRRIGRFHRAGAPLPVSRAKMHAR
jgi:hypothetical protein